MLSQIEINWSRLFSDQFSRQLKNSIVLLYGSLTIRALIRRTISPSSTKPWGLETHSRDRTCAGDAHLPQGHFVDHALDISDNTHHFQQQDSNLELDMLMNENLDSGEFSRLLSQCFNQNTLTDQLLDELLARYRTSLQLTGQLAATLIYINMKFTRPQKISEIINELSQTSVVPTTQLAKLLPLLVKFGNTIILRSYTVYIHRNLPPTLRTRKMLRILISSQIFAFDELITIDLLRELASNSRPIPRSLFNTLCSLSRRSLAVCEQLFFQLETNSLFFSLETDDYLNLFFLLLKYPTIVDNLGIVRSLLNGDPNVLMNIYPRLLKFCCPEEIDLIYSRLNDHFVLRRDDFNNLLIWHGKNANFPSMIKLVHEMRKRCITPDSSTDNIFITEATRSRNPDLLKSYRELVRDNPEFLDDKGKVAMMAFFIQSAKYEEARSTLREIRSNFANFGLTEVFSLVPVLLKLKAHKSLWNLEKCCRNNGYLSNTKLSNEFIRAYSSLDSISRVNSLMQWRMQNGFSPDVFTYSILLGVYAKAGSMCRLRELELEIKRNNLATIALFNTLLSSYAEVITDREQIVTEIARLRMDMELAVIHPNAITYSILVKIYDRIDDVESLKTTALLLRSSPDVKPHHLTTLSNVFDNRQWPVDWHKQE